MTFNYFSKNFLHFLMAKTQCYLFVFALEEKDICYLRVLHS